MVSYRSWELALWSGTPGVFSAERGAEAAVKNAEPLDQNGYKIPLFRGVLEEELAAIARIY